MISGEFLREFVQSVFPASGEHEMRATGGQLPRQGHADSGASTGHQGPRPAPLCRHLFTIPGCIWTALAVDQSVPFDSLVLSLPHGVANAAAFALDSVHQPARPYKFR